MSEQQQIMVNGQPYNVDDLSPTCQELLVRAQNGQNALNVLGTTMELARLGLQILNNDITKLLPSAEEPEELEGELADKVVQ